MPQAVLAPVVLSSIASQVVFRVPEGLDPKALSDAWMRWPRTGQRPALQCVQTAPFLSRLHP
jgi:hypothetical protein